MIPSPVIAIFSIQSLSYAYPLFLWVAFTFNPSLLGHLLGDTAKAMSPGWRLVPLIQNKIKMEWIFGMDFDAFEDWWVEFRA